MRILLTIALFVLLPITTAVFAGPSGYHIDKTYKIGGEGGWDYLTVDSKARRVYISRGTHVMVVDADTGAVVGDIPNTNGVHGIAIASEFDKGFISDGRDGTITIFDLKTLKVLGTATAGKNPDAIIYDPVSKRVFSFNGTSNWVTVADANSLDLTNRMTVEAWVNPASVADWRCVILKESGTTGLAYSLYAADGAAKRHVPDHSVG